MRCPAVHMGVSSRVLACRVMNLPIWGNLLMNVIMQVAGSSRREGFRCISNKDGGSINRSSAQVSFPCQLHHIHMP